MKMTRKFSGKIKLVSTSPHGDVEGLVLDDGSFIKVPPHSLLRAELLTIGAEVSGEGELLSEKPNVVIHHARVRCGQVVAADDSGDKKVKEKLKEKHKADLALRKDSPLKEITHRGRLAAIGTKPKGEVDRLIFDDGTSVHIGRHAEELNSEDCTLGEMFEVVGESRSYGKNRFIKAEKVRSL